jgi:hypothetical protein
MEMTNMTIIRDQDDNPKAHKDRATLIAEILTLLEETPRRVLDFGFGGSVVLIQSESNTYDGACPRQERVISAEPSLLTIWDFTYFKKSCSPTSFYYSWQVVTTAGGLFMDSAGKFYHAKLIGKGRYASFASGPGDTGVSIEVQYVRTDLTFSDLSVADINLVSKYLSEALWRADDNLNLLLAP